MNTWQHDSACACNALINVPAENIWTAMAQQMTASAQPQQASGERHAS
jgi:hypothetical protein